MSRRLFSATNDFLSRGRFLSKLVVLVPNVLLPIFLLAQTPELIIHKGHSTQINAVAFSKDFETIISAASDEILVWDFTLGYEVLRFSPKQQGVTGLAFNENDSVIFSAGIDGTIKAWNLNNQFELASTKAHSNAITKIVLSPDCKTLISGDNSGIVRVWDAATLILRYEIDIHHEFLRDIDIHPDGKSFAIANQDRKVSIWDLESGKISYLLGGDIPLKAKFSESGKYLFIEGTGKVKVWETSNYEIINEYAQQKRIWGFLTSGDSIKIIETDEYVKSSSDKLRYVSWDFINNIEHTGNFDPDSSEYFVLRSKLINSGGKYSYWTASNGGLTLLRFKDLKIEKVLGGTAGPIMDIAYDPDHNVLAIAGNNGTSKLFSFSNSAVNSEIFSPNMRNVLFSPKSNYLATSNSLFHFPSLKLIAKNEGSRSWTFLSYYLKNNYSAGFSSDGDLLANNYLRNEVTVIETATGDTIKRFQNPTKDHYPEMLIYKNNLILSLVDSIYQYDLADFSLSRSVHANFIQRPFISHDGTKIIGITHIGIEQLNIDTHENILLKKHGNNESFIWAKQFLDSTMIIAATSNHIIELMNSPDWEVTHQLIGHTGVITDGEFILNDRYFVSSSLDGTVRFWDWESKKLVLTFISLKDGDYVTIAPNGLFDSTPNAFSLLHYKISNEIISIDQLKDRYYEPNLLQKVLGLSNEPLRNSKGLGSVDLFPEIDIAHPMQNNGIMGINLTNRGGGIGKVKIWINGKEVTSDARDPNSDKNAQTVTINYKIDGHPYLKPGEANEIIVKSYNAEEYLSSRGKKIYYIPKGKKEDYDPTLYGIIIGTSNYSGDALDLKYAAKDAADFANALELTGNGYFEEGKVNIKLLTTQNEDFTTWPTKENIETAFQQISTTANPYDVLVVYLSGHGVNYGGSEGDFYYLTSDATSGGLRDPAIRESVAISSAEFTEYIKMVPALKQVMIIDACHSGQLAEDIMAAKADRPSSEIRALERMKDRTGMYVLAGSAADAVSYETSVYGQGLLTYSLLFGMKGAALRENKFVDVMQLFQFAADEVPRLAQNIGGIQKPEIRVPYGGQSFDIGISSEEVQKKIVLPSPKPLFVRSSFENENTFNDDLRLSEQVDDLLKEYGGTRGEKQSLIFIDAVRFVDAYSLKGRYAQSPDGYEVDVRLFKGDTIISKFKATESPDKLAEMLVNILQKEME